MIEQLGFWISGFFQLCAAIVVSMTLISAIRARTQFVNVMDRTMLDLFMAIVVMLMAIYTKL